MIITTKIKLTIMIIIMIIIYFTNLEMEVSWNIWKFKPIFLLTINYFYQRFLSWKIFTMIFTTQDFQRMFDHFSTLCMKELIIVWQSPRYPSECDNNLLSANPAKWSNTLKQIIGCCQEIVWVCLIILWGWRLKW